MKHIGQTRRAVVGGMSGLAAGYATGAFGQSLPLPSQPVELNVIDVAGQLQLTQAGIDRFRQQNPKLVSHINYGRAPSPELPAKIKAQQAAGRVDIDLVLTGPGAMSDGAEQGLWIEVWSKYPDALPNPDATYSASALVMQKNFGRDQGVAVVYSPSGPLFEYAPDRLKSVPKTAADLLTWAKANPEPDDLCAPGEFRPRLDLPDGHALHPGRHAIPKDPIKGWDKTWAWLRELGTRDRLLPGGHDAQTMKELGDGTRDVIVSTCGWDINPRVLGIVPKEAEVFALEGTHWVPDTQFMCIPKGVSNDKVAVLLAADVLHAEARAAGAHLRQGLLLPGPGREGRDARHGAAREPGRDQGIRPADLRRSSSPSCRPRCRSPPPRLVAAFRRWDEEIGAKKLK